MLWHRLLLVLLLMLVFQLQQLLLVCWLWLWLSHALLSQRHQLLLRWCVVAAVVAVVLPLQLLPPVAAV